MTDPDTRPSPEQHYARALDLQRAARRRGYSQDGRMLRQDALIEAVLSVAASLLRQRGERAR